MTRSCPLALTGPLPLVACVLALGLLWAPPGRAAVDDANVRAAGAAEEPGGEEPDDDDAANDDASSEDEETSSDEAEDEEEDEGPFEKWDEVIEDTERIDGMLPIYRKREDVYLELSASHFEDDYLLALSIERGIGARYVLGGLTWGTTVVNFRRNGDHIHLVEPNTRFVSSADEALGKAVDLSFGESILESFPIKSENDSTGAIIVDVGGFLTSDYADLGFFLGTAFDGSVSLDGARSHVDGIKSFPENVEIDVSLTYTPGSRKDLSLPSVSDARYIPISVHYSLSKLPETTYVPRYADDRVGYFLTAQKDFSRGDDSGYFRRYVKRWHLEKKDPGKTRSEPVEPITFYIDETVPEPYRKYVRQGIEAWQVAFEEAGFEKAIVAKDYPKNDPDYDPADVRYNTIRWITTNEPSFGAIGPSRMDPRTGQILDSDVLVDDIFLLGIRNGYRRLVDTRALAGAESFPYAFLDPLVRKIWETEGLREDIRQNVCTLSDGFGLSAALVGMSLLDAGRLKPGEPVPIEYVGEGLRWVIMHEVGHTLGLRHNFKSSTDTPYEKLHDKKWVEAHGLTSSVMDYAAPNISVDPDKQGYYYGPQVGTYDRWAIRYGYTPFGARTPDDERDDLAKIAAESMQPGHTYGTDEDTYPSGACDPMCNIWDLSADPIANAERVYALTDRLITREDLDAVMLGPGDEYTKLRRAVNSLLGSRFVSFTNAFKYVGGSYVSRDHYGTPGARPAFRPVPAVEQRRALDFVARHAFADDLVPIDPTVLNDLAPDRWAHWGNDAFESNMRMDYPLHDWVDTFHHASLNALFSPVQLRRMQEAEYKSDDVVTIAELYDTITASIWGELDDANPSISSIRRNAQRVHVAMLIDHALTDDDGMPNDARALARLHLSRLDRRLAAMPEGAVADDYTLAHLELMRAEIRQALDASLITEM